MSQFAEDTAVKQIADNLWRGNLHAAWRGGAAPLGGYVLAVAGQALRAALPHRDPLTVNAFFLAPAEPGPIDCRLELLRKGRSMTHAEARMYQGNELKLHVTAAFADLDALQGADWSAHERPEVAAWQRCEPIASWSRVPCFRERLDVRLDQGAALYTRREADGSGVLTGWMAASDGAEPDVISLLMYADAFPPSIFNRFGLQRWVPTLELSVQVRARPAPGPLQARFCSRHLTRGVLEEDGEIWDSGGSLVALSRQTAKLRLQGAPDQ